MTYWVLAWAIAAAKRTFFIQQRSLLDAESHCVVLRLPVYLQTLLQVSVACQENPLSVVIHILDVDCTDVIEVEPPRNLYLQISEGTIG